MYALGSRDRQHGCDDIVSGDQRQGRIGIEQPANRDTQHALERRDLHRTSGDPPLGQRVGSRERLDASRLLSGSTLIGTAAAMPIVLTCERTVGRDMLRAVAYDGAGASASSATATITVANPLALRPSGVAFTPSVDHASVTR